MPSGKDDSIISVEEMAAAFEKLRASSGDVVEAPAEELPEDALEELQASDDSSVSFTTPPPFEKMFEIISTLPKKLTKKVREKKEDSDGGSGEPPADFADDKLNPDDPRPEIFIKPGKTVQMCEEAIRALAKFDPNLYQRGGDLVYLIREPEVDKKYEADAHVGLDILTRPGTPKIYSLNLAGLRKHLAKAAKWFKQGKKPNVWNITNPDKDIAEMLYKEHDWPGVRPIAGILETPSLSPSGRLICEPGYDDETHFVFLPTIEIEPIPDAPTQEEAKEALKFIWINMFGDLPYQELGPHDPTDLDRSARFAKACLTCPDAFVAVHALLTILSRPAIRGPVPGVVFEASTQGSGKSLQLHLIAMAATGRAASVMTYPIGNNGKTDEAELEKILAGYAMGGTRIVCYDNLRGELGGPAIEKVMTAYQTIDLRVLGHSDMLSLPWAAVTMFSGNNMSMNEDMGQRVTISRLVPLTEDPRSRKAQEFLHPNILEWVREHRAEIVRACLIIMRAFFCATDKPTGEMWGSFEAWSQIIPLAIKYAGGADIMQTRPKGGGFSEDSESGAHGTLLKYWPEAFNKGLRKDEKGKRLYNPKLDGDDSLVEGIKAIDIIKYVYAHEASAFGKDELNEPNFVELRVVLRALTNTKEGQQPSPTKLGHTLRRLRGKIKSGKHLDGVIGADNVTCWQVK